MPNQIQPGYKTPSTDEFTVGADHQIFTDFAVSGTFTYRNTKNLQDTIAIGSDASTLRPSSGPRKAGLHPESDGARTTSAGPSTG